MIQPSKFEKVAQNLDALDLELSQTKRLYDIIHTGSQQQNPALENQRNIGGDLMESLDLQTGYRGVLDHQE